MKKHTEMLLNAGIVAGPFFIILALLLAFTREGFDWVRHPASLLSVGELGWTQILNFVITGILYIASAFGLKKIVSAGIGSRLVPLLFTVLGLALIGGGIFTADPSLGFPPGTPEGVPAQMSWHAMLHGIAPIVGFLALVAAQITLGRRFGAKGESIVMWITIIVAIGTFILSFMPSATGNMDTGEFNFLPLWAGVAIGYGYTSYLLWKLKQEWQGKK